MIIHYEQAKTMDLRSDYPFWLLDRGIIHSYPSLLQDLKTDIVIMGAGISGALTAWHLCHAGFKVVVVDKRHVGMQRKIRLQ